MKDAPACKATYVNAWQCKAVYVRCTHLQGNVWQGVAILGNVCKMHQLARQRMAMNGNVRQYKAIQVMNDNVCEMYSILQIFD